MSALVQSFCCAFLLWLYTILYRNDDLRHIPGPFSYRISKWRLAWDDWTYSRQATLLHLHKRYGNVIRIGPREVHILSRSGMRLIMRSFDRTDYYKLFKVGGEDVMLSMAESTVHDKRRRTLAPSYSKTRVLRSEEAASIEHTLPVFMNRLILQAHRDVELTELVQYYHLDWVTSFLFGPENATSTLTDHGSHRQILAGHFDCRRDWLFILETHMASLVDWVYASPSPLARHLMRYFPVRTHQGIRRFASEMITHGDIPSTCQAGRLLDAGVSKTAVAAEMSDHLMATVDPLSSRTTFIIELLSAHPVVQARLQDEVRCLTESQLNQYGNPTRACCEPLPYLDAVVREGLRLFTPPPEPQQRWSQSTCSIEGYRIPPYTKISMSSYHLHMNETVFTHAAAFDPERWLQGNDDSELYRWYRPFVEGPKKCIGAAWVLNITLHRYVADTRQRRRDGHENIVGNSIPSVHDYSRVSWSSLFDKRRSPHTTAPLNVNSVLGHSGTSNQSSVLSP